MSERTLLGSLLPLEWVTHEPTFKTLVFGRIELGQICQAVGGDVDSWFYTLRFCRPTERASYSCLTQERAKRAVEYHAMRVLEASS